MDFVLKLTSHCILHYLCPADLSKSFSQLIVPIFIFTQYFFFNRFCPVEKAPLTVSKFIIFQYFFQ